MSWQYYKADGSSIDWQKLADRHPEQHKRDFILRWGPLAEKYAPKLGTSPASLLGQMVAEATSVERERPKTGIPPGRWGQSQNAIVANNMFGIKRRDNDPIHHGLSGYKKWSPERDGADGWVSDFIDLKSAHQKLVQQAGGDAGKVPSADEMMMISYVSHIAHRDTNRYHGGIGIADPKQYAYTIGRLGYHLSNTHRYASTVERAANEIMPGYVHRNTKTRAELIADLKREFPLAGRDRPLDHLLGETIDGGTLTNGQQTERTRSVPPPPPIDEDKAKKVLAQLSVADFNTIYESYRQRAEAYNNTEGLSEDKKVDLPSKVQLVDPATVEDDPSTPEKDEKALAQAEYERVRTQMTDQIIKTSKELQDRGNLTPQTQKEERAEGNPDQTPQRQHQQETERRNTERRQSNSTENTRSHLNGPGNNMPDDILILLLLIMLIAPEAAMQIWNWYMSGRGNGVNNGPSDRTRNRVRNPDGTPRRQQGLESPDDVKQYRESTDPNTERFKTRPEFENGGHNRALFGSGIPGEVNGEQVNYVPGVTHQIPFSKDGSRFQQFGIRLWDSKTQSESKVLYYIADRDTGKVIYSAVHDSGGAGRNAAPGTSGIDIMREIAGDSAKAKLWKENPILAQLSNDDVNGYLNTPHRRDKDALDHAKLYILGLPPGKGEQELTDVQAIIQRGRERYAAYEREKDKPGFDRNSIPGLSSLPKGMRIINFNPEVMDKLEIDPADIARGKLSLPKLRAGESRIALYVGHGWWNGNYDSGTPALQRQVERMAQAAGIRGDFSIFDEHNMNAALMREVKAQLMLKSKDGVHYRDDQVYIVQATREMRFNAKNGYAPFRSISRQTDATVHLEAHFNDSGAHGSRPSVRGAAMYFSSNDGPTAEGRDLANRIAQAWSQNGIKLWGDGVKYQSSRLGMMSGSNFRGKRSDGTNMAHGLIEGEFLDNPEALRRFVEEVKDASGKTIGYRINRDAMRQLAAPIAQAIHEQQIAKGLGPGKKFEGEPERTPPYAYFVEDLGENEGLKGSGPPRPYEREKLTRRELAQAIVQRLPDDKLPDGKPRFTSNGGPITAILDNQGRLVAGNKPFERVDPASTAKHAVVLALIKKFEADDKKFIAEGKHMVDGKRQPLPSEKFWKDPENVRDLEMIAGPDSSRGINLDNYNRATQRLVARAMGVTIPRNGTVGPEHKQQMGQFINTYMNGAIVDGLGLVDTHFSSEYMVAQRGGFRGYSGLVGMNTEKGGDTGNYVTAYDGVRIQQALAKYASNPAYSSLIDNMLASRSRTLGTISSGFSGDRDQWVAKTGTAGGDYGPKREGESGVRAFVAAHKTQGIAFGVFETSSSQMGTVVGKLRRDALKNIDGINIEIIRRQIVEERIQQERIETERQQQERVQPSRHEYYPGNSDLSNLKLAQEVKPISPVTAMPKATLRDLIARHYPQHHEAMNKLATDLGIEGKLDIRMTAIDYMKFITGRTDLLSPELKEQIGDLPDAFKASLYERGKGDDTPLARFNMSGGKAPYCAGTIANALMLSYPEIAAAWQRQDVFKNLSTYHQSEIEGEDIGDNKYKYGKIVDVQAFFTVGQKLGLLQTNQDGSPATYSDIKYDDLKEGSIIAFAPRGHENNLASPKGSDKSGMSGHHLGMIVGKGRDAQGDYVLVASGNNGHGPNGERGQSGLHTYKVYKQEDGTIQELGGSKRPIAWHFPPERLQAYHELYQATAERIKVENIVQTQRAEVRAEIPDTKRFSVLDGILPIPERELRGLVRQSQPVIKQGHVYDPNAKWYAFGDSTALGIANVMGDRVTGFDGTMTHSDAGVIANDKRVKSSAELLELEDWNANLAAIGKNSHANIIVSMGYNDIKQNVSATQIMDKMRPILDKMIADGTTPVIAGLHSGSKDLSATGQEKIRSLNRLLENYAKEKGLVYVDVAAIERRMGADTFLQSDNVQISDEGKREIFKEADRLLRDAAKQAAEAKEAAERAAKDYALLRTDVTPDTNPDGLANFIPTYDPKTGRKNGNAKSTYGEQEWLGLSAKEQQAQPWLKGLMGAMNGENGRAVAERENPYLKHSIGNSIPRTPQRGVPIIPESLYKYANEEGWIGFKIADKYGINAAGNAAAIGQIGMFNIRTGEYKTYSFGSGGKGGKDEGDRGAPSPTLVSHDTWGPERGQDHKLIRGVAYVGAVSDQYTGSKSGINFGASVDWIDPMRGRGDTMGHRVFGTPERIVNGRFSLGCEAIVNNGAFVNDLRSTKMDRAGSRFIVLDSSVERLPLGVMKLPLDKVPEKWRFARAENGMTADEFRKIKTMTPEQFQAYQRTRKAGLEVPGGIRHAFVRAGVSITDPEKAEDNSLSAIATVRVAMAGPMDAVKKLEAARSQQIAFAVVDDAEQRKAAKETKADDDNLSPNVKPDGEVKTGKEVSPTQVAVATADADPKKKEAVATATA